jgi:hypothetical protein
MLLTFDRGDAHRPRGHALLYFRSWSDPSTVFATYLIVPPISVEISKYIPPMFAAQFQGLGGRGITVFPYPPIPEQVDGQEFLARLAEARDDDLISGASVDTSSPDRLLQASAEAAQQYFESFSSYMDALPAESIPESVPERSSVSVDVNDLMYGLMSERERLAELTKLSGQLRYAVGGGDERLTASTEEDITKLISLLPEKYRAADIAKAARRPGPQGERLTQLFIERAYKLADEDYESVSRLEAEIRQFSET